VSNCVCFKCHNIQTVSCKVASKQGSNYIHTPICSSLPVAAFNMPRTITSFNRAIKQGSNFIHTPICFSFHFAMFNRPRTIIAFNVAAKQGQTFCTHPAERGLSALLRSACHARSCPSIVQSSRGQIVYIRPFASLSTLPCSTDHAPSLPSMLQPSRVKLYLHTLQKEFFSMFSRPRTIIAFNVAAKQGQTLYTQPAERGLFHVQQTTHHHCLQCCSQAGSNFMYTPCGKRTFPVTAFNMPRTIMSFNHAIKQGIHFIHTPICFSFHIDTHKHKRTNTHTQTQTQTYTHKHTDTHTNTHTLTHTHTNTHTHTHTHTTDHARPSGSSRDWAQLRAQSH